MSNHNYSKYSNKKHNNNKPAVEPSYTVKMEVEPVETSIVSVTEPVEVTTMSVAEPAFMEETVETVAIPEIIKGTVANCMKLNVRVKPRADADVLCVLDVNSELEIDMEKSNSDWFHINTAAGVDGYCMRRFVNAKL